ncbi:hypothetical protein KLN27_15175 [Clostridioides difficile]|nr:hypothetical protein [Clostridioides difficile]MDO0221586.1 hypothetical protein [Clostridioides difficile]HAT4871058.1 hypothetical protein [Clostridioides difficile]HBF9019383.1 hypothetical protein [Clostridioides difficile]HBG1771599.1 hypothetical protein [Clostridioides difficile]
MTKYKIEDRTNLIIHQSKKYNVKFILIPENEDKREILKKVFKILKEGTYCVSIEGKLSSGEVELENVTITVFVDGNIILKNEGIEISGEYKVEY